MEEGGDTEEGEDTEEGGKLFAGIMETRIPRVMSRKREQEILDLDNEHHLANEILFFVRIRGDNLRSREEAKAEVVSILNAPSTNTLIITKRIYLLAPLDDNCEFNFEIDGTYRNVANWFLGLCSMKLREEKKDGRMDVFREGQYGYYRGLILLEKEDRGFLSRQTRRFSLELKAMPSSSLARGVPRTVVVTRWIQRYIRSPAQYKITLSFTEKLIIIEVTKASRSFVITPCYPTAG
ncbi:hypothetical protein V1477_008709 [Vespula maculifrons]|uniref:Uncharacterized protein n=1 Tax=Vespula maculifrons TaxID=7453 RepID=A0ABD2CDT0_VESMC